MHLYFFRDTELSELHEVIITPPPEEATLGLPSDGSQEASEPLTEASSPSGKSRRARGDTSKRRKGVYITQWPEPSETDKSKLSAQSSEEKDEPPATPSDLSDCEGQTPRRFFLYLLFQFQKFSLYSSSLIFLLKVQQETTARSLRANAGS